MGFLKQLIDSSAQKGQAKIAPMSLRVSAQPFLEFAQTVDGNPAIAALLQALQGANGKDHLSITATSIPRGATYRIEIEEGLLMLIGTAGMMQNAGPGGNFR